ncbi:MAG: hypothetical protein K2O27_00980 [Candidatus Amulumruptor sp.]|nr:hypothetical protein [Candidatus Amulumruptor sp.]
MKQIITFLMLLIGVCTMPCYATAEQEGEVEDLRFNPDQGGTSDHPMKPAYSPIYGVVSGDLLTIFSKVSGEANVTVADATGTVIMSQPVADLTYGYPVMLPAEKTGLKVSVIFNGVTYSATF